MSEIHHIRSRSLVKLTQYAELSINRIASLFVADPSSKEARVRVLYMEDVAVQMLEAAKRLREEFPGGEVPPEGSYDGDLEADILRMLAALPGMDEPS
jgi:hypothetical protein